MSQAAIVGMDYMVPAGTRLAIDDVTLFLLPPKPWMDQQDEDSALVYCVIEHRERLACCDPGWWYNTRDDRCMSTQLGSLGNMGRRMDPGCDCSTKSSQVPTVNNLSDCEVILVTLQRWGCGLLRRGTKITTICLIRIASLQWCIDSGIRTKC